MKVVSVLLPVYNEPIEYLEKALASIVNQTFKNLEILIMIDNPLNLQAIKFFRGKALYDDRIRVNVNEENLGLVKTLNKALEISTGDYIARMDADDICETTRIEVQYNFLRKSKLDLIGSSYDTFMESPENAKDTVVVPNNEEIASHLEFESCLAHPTWFGNREVFITLGYREIFACEDYDFLVRAKRSGYKLGNCSDVLLHYRINPNSISHTNRMQQKITFKYLSYNFKREVDVSMQDYRDFLESEDYRILKKAYNNVFQIKEGNLKNKVVSGIKLCLDLKTLRIYLKYK